MSSNSPRHRRFAAERPQPSRIHKSTRHARACVNCHQHKVRCDIVDKGVPCTNCSSRKRPGCHLSLTKKKAKELVTRTVSPVPIRPKGSIDSPATVSPLSQPAEPGVPNSPEDGEHDPGNLAHLLNHNDTRAADLDHQTRSQFIGSELSNCHYLIRQSSSDREQDKVFHFSNGIHNPLWVSYQAYGVPDEVLKRPDKKLEERLIKAYFYLVNRGWPIVDEELFMMQYQEQDPVNPLSLALLNAMFLVGAHALASQDDTMLPIIPIFFQRAKILAESRFGQDRLVCVQVALLMIWYPNVNAWHWIGIATRTAMALGMHRDVSHSKMLPVYKRSFTRLWWVLFQFDTIASASTGRPQVINLADSDVPDLQPHDFEGISGVEIDFVVHQTKLCKIISSTVREGWAPRASMETRIQAIRRADESLGELMLQIPSRVQLKLSNLDTWQAVFHLTYHNAILLLHRPAPSLNTADQNGDDAALCRESTVTIGSIFEILLNQKALSTLWLYSNHCLFTATIYVLNQINTSRPLFAAKSRQIFDTLLASLRELSKYWIYAKGLLQVFEQRVSKQGDLAPRIRSHFTEAPEQNGSQSLEAQLNPPNRTLRQQQASESSSDLRELHSQAVANSSAHPFESYLGSCTIAAETDCMGANQDPLLDDLFLLDGSAFDFLFHESIGSRTELDSI